MQEESGADDFEDNKKIVFLVNQETPIVIAPYNIQCRKNLYTQIEREWATVKKLCNLHSTKK